MKSPDRHMRYGAFTAQPLFQPLAHLRRRLIGKRNCGDLVGLDTAIFHQVGDPGDERFCLTGTGAGDDRHTAPVRINSCQLLWVEQLLRHRFFRFVIRFGISWRLFPFELRRCTMDL